MHIRWSVKVIVIAAACGLGAACSKAEEPRADASPRSTTDTVAAIDSTHSGHAAADTAASTVTDHTAHTTPVAGGIDVERGAPGHSAHTPPNAASSEQGDHSLHAASTARGAKPAAHATHVPARTRPHDAHQEHSSATPQRATIPVGEHTSHGAPVRNSAAVASTSATAKLHALAAALTKDPAIQQAIARDTTLARLWRNAAVRSRMQHAADEP